MRGGTFLVMLLVSFLAAAVLSSFTPTPTPPSAPGPYILVEKDGNLIRLMRPPAQRGNGLVGYLWPKGELVTVRLDNVDAKKTADANKSAAVTPGVGTTVISQTTGAAGPRVPLGDRVKLVKSRSEAEKTLQKASGTGKKKVPAEELPERAEPGSNRKPIDESVAEGTGEAGEILDKDGRNEAYWRAKAERAKNDLADAEGELRLALQDQDRHERYMPAPGQGAAATWALELQRLRDAVDRARVKVENAKRRLDELAEAARVAGAYPGWVR